MRPIPTLLFMLLALTLVTLESAPVAGLQQYGLLIPNGLNVNRLGVQWRAAGHAHPTEGVEDLNAFGVDFQAAGHKWSRELCEGDSDGDGYSNGEELGDSLCTWDASEVPSRSTDIAHPGYADSTPTTFMPGEHTASSSPPPPSPSPSPSPPPATEAPMMPATPHPLEPANNFGIRVLTGLVIDVADLANASSPPARRTVTLRLANGAQWNVSYCTDARVTITPLSQHSLEFGVVRFLTAAVRDDSVGCTPEVMTMLFHPVSEAALTFPDVLRISFVGSFTTGEIPEDPFFEVLFLPNAIDPNQSTTSELEPSASPTPDTTTAEPTAQPPPTPAPTPVPMSRTINIPVEGEEPFRLRNFLGMGRVLRDIVVALGVTLIAVLLPVVYLLCQPRRKTLRLGGRVGTWEEVYSGRVQHALVPAKTVAPMSNDRKAVASGGGKQVVHASGAKKALRNANGETRERTAADADVEMSFHDGANADEVSPTKRLESKNDCCSVLGPYDDHTWRMASQWTSLHEGVLKVYKFDKKHHIRTPAPTKEWVIQPLVGVVATSAPPAGVHVDAAAGGRVPISPNAANKEGAFLMDHSVHGTTKMNPLRPSGSSAAPPPPPPSEAVAAGPRSQRSELSTGELLVPLLTSGGSGATAAAPAGRDSDNDSLFGPSAPQLSQNRQQRPIREQIQHEEMRLRMTHGGVADVSREWKPTARRLRGGPAAQRAASQLSTPAYADGSAAASQAPRSLSSSSTSPHKSASPSRSTAPRGRPTPTAAASQRVLRRGGEVQPAMDVVPLRAHRMMELEEQELLAAEGLALNPFDRSGWRVPRVSRAELEQRHADDTL